MTHYPLHIFSGTANRPLAERIAECLNLELGACETKHLADTEVYVEIHEAIRGQDIFFIQPCGPPVNDNLMELLLYVDAFRRASAHSITVVIPYYPYSRQERMAHGREAISARVVARMLQTLGVTRVVYVDIHAEATQGFFDIPVDPLSARKVFIEYFQEKKIENPIIVAPDVGRAKLAGRYAEVMGMPLALMHKRRLSHSEVETSHVVGDLRDKTPIVIDDMIAGGSILTQLNALVETALANNPNLRLAQARDAFADLVHIGRRERQTEGGVVGVGAEERRAGHEGHALLEKKKIETAEKTGKSQDDTPKDKNSRNLKEKK